MTADVAESTPPRDWLGSVRCGSDARHRYLTSADAKSRTCRTQRGALHFATRPECDAALLAWLHQNARGHVRAVPTWVRREEAAA